MTEHDEAVMSAETLDQMERCYKNWNGSAVMEAAFSKLLAEVKRLRAKSSPQIDDDTVERACKEFYEDYFSGVEDLEPKWGASKHEGRAVDPSYWHRMRSAMRAALTAALEEVKK